MTSLTLTARPSRWRRSITTSGGAPGWAGSSYTPSGTATPYPNDGRHPVPPGLGLEDLDQRAHLPLGLVKRILAEGMRAGPSCLGPPPCGGVVPERPALRLQHEQAVHRVGHQEVALPLDRRLVPSPRGEHPVDAVVDDVLVGKLVEEPLVQAAFGRAHGGKHGERHHPGHGRGPPVRPVARSRARCSCRWPARGPSPPRRPPPTPSAGPAARTGRAAGGCAGS